MFDRFTDRARKALGLSREAALRNRHDYIAPEHILLGLLEVHGVAEDVLKAFHVPRRKLAAAVEKRLPAGVTMVTMGQLPFTPGAKLVLERALEEASGLDHNYIGTEHLLLGLVRDDGGAGAVLREAGLAVDAVRIQVLELLGAEVADARSGRSVLVLASNDSLVEEVVRPALTAAAVLCDVIDPETCDAGELEWRCHATDVAIVVAPASPGIVFAAGICRGVGRPVVVFAAEPDKVPGPLASLPVVSTGEQLRDILQPKEP